MTAAAHDGTDCAQVGTEGWCRSNKRMGLPNTASRTLYRVREAEVPILSAAITVMKKISFRSILLRPSYCARPIRSPDFKPLCYRWGRPILWATLTVETKRKPSRILIRKFGESHQTPCSGSHCSYRGCARTLPYKGWLKIGDNCYCGESCATRDNKLRGKEESSI